MKDENKYIEIQNALKDKLDFENMIDVTTLKTIAGVDLAYWNEGDKEMAVCCIVTVDYVTHKVIETKSYSGEIKFPYIPGLLSFRELPLVAETVKLLETQPDIYMFDGNGYLHPRHMGIASQASFILNRPTIGVAKSYYKVEDTDYTEPANERGSRSDIIINSEVYGCALRTADNVRPVFVSKGNHTTLEDSVRIVLDMTEKESHIPVPTRLADLETHKMRNILREK